MKKIFTFWEPQNSIPPYVALCMETWKKFLPEYEIVILNYTNLSQYLDKKTIKAVLTKRTSLAKQADCIRVAVLYQYGGIWLDADTIITNSGFFKGLNSSDCVMIGTDTSAHLAFIYSSQPQNSFLGIWLKQITKRVKKYKWFHKGKLQSKIFSTICKKTYKETENWDYFGNAVINPLIKKHTKGLSIISRMETAAFLEDFSLLNNNEDISKKDLYIKFYFNQAGEKEIEHVLMQNKGIILLHNSWTPQNYKALQRQAFIESPIALAEILRKVLNS